MIEIISAVSKIRKRYVDFIKPENYIKFPYNSKFVVAFGYKLELKDEKYLIVIANADLLRAKRVEINLEKAQLGLAREIKEVGTLFALKSTSPEKFQDQKLSIFLEPLDIKIVLAK